MEASTEASTITVGAIANCETAIQKLYCNNSCNFVFSTVPERSSCTSELQLSTSNVLQEPRFHYKKIVQRAAFLLCMRDQF
jgi:hypothetical protein